MTTILVTGSRRWTDRSTIRNALLAAAGEHPELVHGNARGADTIAHELALEWAWPIHIYPAEWDLLGRRAGAVRNQRMLDQASPDIVLAFPLPGSTGTLDMIERATKAGLMVAVYEPRATVRERLMERRA